MLLTALAGDQRTPAELVDRLAHGSDPHVKALVAVHPSLPCDVDLRDAQVDHVRSALTLPRTQDLRDRLLRALRPQTRIGLAASDPYLCAADTGAPVAPKPVHTEGRPDGPDRKDEGLLALRRCLRTMGSSRVILTQ